ncbi:TetR/AcrR family transcriptional regulator [Deinococcus alpinitundrae]|uniref:TetR/AcrR family transcriptional regulator n=1 Tax=Deinococcus alpinitundrae TaxID=468913 RepID=UPI00137A9189|nr:TetR/AcrR family transcriptional regulator [Deinococcus alpinitundrae]
MPYPSKLTPDSILQAAQTLLDAGGPASLNMRPLAAALGVQASSLYRHFSDRETLLRALEDVAASEFDQVLRAASSGKAPREALWAAAEAYLDQARRFPHRYGLLLSPRPPAAAQPSPSKNLWNIVLHLVSALSGQPDDTTRTVALWAYLHGYAVLDRSGLFGLSGPRGGFDLGLTALLDEMERA